MQLSGDTSRGSVKLEVVDDLDDASSKSAKAQPKAPLFPPQPGIDHKLMEDFLNGDYCLHGVSTVVRSEQRLFSAYRTEA